MVQASEKKSMESRLPIFCALLLLSGCTWIFGSIQRTELASSALCQTDASEASGYSAGTGSTADPYIICTAAQWNAIGPKPGDWSKSFKLGKNIDLSSITYNMIGSSANPFSGRINGNGKTISGLTQNLSSDNGGLIRVAAGATVSDLTVSGFSIEISTASHPAGFFVGEATGPLVFSNVRVASSTFLRTDTATSYAGGLVGDSSSSIQVNTATIQSVDLFASSIAGVHGGVVGRADTLIATDVTITGLRTFDGTFYPLDTGGVAGVILNSLNLNRAVITSSSLRANSLAGGLVGSFSAGSGIIQNSQVSNMTLLRGFTGVGGIVGGHVATVNIQNCGVSTNIIGGSNTHGGGLVGVSNGSLSIDSSYYVGALSGNASTNLGGLLGIQAVAGSISISNSYARGSVTATIAGGNTANLGGLIGQLNAGGGDALTVTNSYAANTVTSAPAAASGFGCGVGSALSGTTTFAASFYDTICTHAGYTGGAIANFTAQATVSMQTPATFTGAGWSTSFWTLPASSYPKVFWEP